MGDGRKHRVFVYGTLLRGERNATLLRTSRFLGETATAKGFRLFDLGSYPAMAKAESGTVIGELFEVDDATLAGLDRLEDHPNVYWRTEIQLVDRRRALTYLMPMERLRSCPRIASGDWRQRAASTEPDSGFGDPQQRVRGEDR